MPQLNSFIDRRYIDLHTYISTHVRTLASLRIMMAPTKQAIITLTTVALTILILSVVQIKSKLPLGELATLKPYRVTASKAALSAGEPEWRAHARRVGLPAELIPHVEAIHESMRSNDRFRSRHIVNGGGEAQSPSLPAWHEYLRGVYFINLETRTDRKEAFVSEMNKTGVPDEKIVRIPAPRTKHGGTGCALSHYAVVQYLLLTLDESPPESAAPTWWSTWSMLNQLRGSPPKRNPQERFVFIGEDDFTVGGCRRLLGTASGRLPSYI
eukprot:GHVU01100659.1.p1 GENE.GHVU01100659.1~~GHVU01100659.1.p1  ORF type:complete len:269 (+),score=17.10 GHVU01100659.1:176-982(+)